MTSIEQWNESQQSIYFYGEEDSPEKFQHGGLKTKNPTGNPAQRDYVHISNTKSAYKRTVEMVICAHGQDYEKQHVTLMVFRVHLSCTNSSRFKSAKLHFSFAQEVSDGENEEDIVPPEVLSYGPFYDQQRFTAGEQTKTLRSHLDGVLGANAGSGKAEFAAGKEWEKSFVKEMYARAHADPDYQDHLGFSTGVAWHFAEAEATKDGVLPDFHLAIVVRPPHRRGEREARTFTGKLKIRVAAGIKEWFDGFFRERESDNHPVIFNPALPLHIRGTGERARALLEKPNARSVDRLDQDSVDVNKSPESQGTLQLGDYMGFGLLAVIGAVQKSG